MHEHVENPLQKKSDQPAVIQHLRRQMCKTGGPSRKSTPSDSKKLPGPLAAVQRAQTQMRPTLPLPASTKVKTFAIHPLPEIKTGVK
jgi:hypothetical protein